MNADIFGKAIAAFYETKKEQLIIVKNEAFEDDEIKTSYLFRDFNNMPLLEQKALKLCNGEILDIGCGAGSHSLYLQHQEKKVYALDLSKKAIDICKKRGVLNCITKDFYNTEGTYDTLLLLMNGSGIIGKLNNFTSFFNKVKELLNPKGQVLMDSSDLIYLYENENNEFWVETSKYYGEMSYQISYKDEISNPFDWLYVDFNTLKRASQIHGFNCELIFEGDHYDYLARLSL